MPPPAVTSAGNKLVALLVTACAASIAVALLGWFLGSAPLSAVEPNAQFINCGPALFGRPDPLPHPECLDAYFPLPFLSVMLMLAGTLGVVATIFLAFRRPTSVSPQQSARQPAQRALPKG